MKSKEVRLCMAVRYKALAALGLNVENQPSNVALSQQLPCQLILHLMPRCWSDRW